VCNSKIVKLFAEKRYKSKASHYSRKNFPDKGEKKQKIKSLTSKMDDFLEFANKSTKKNDQYSLYWSRHGRSFGLTSLRSQRQVESSGHPLVAEGIFSTSFVMYVPGWSIWKVVKHYTPGR